MSETATPRAVLERSEDLPRAELVRELAKLEYSFGTFPEGTYDAYIPGSLDELVLLVVQGKLSKTEMEEILALQKKGVAHGERA